MKSNRRVSLTFMVAAAAILSLSFAACLRAADANEGASSHLSEEALMASIKASLEKTQEAVAAYEMQEPPKLAADPFVGEYVGTFKGDTDAALPALAKIFFDPTVKLNGGYRARLYAVGSGLIDQAVIGEKTKCKYAILMAGTVTEGKLQLAGQNWQGVVEGDKCSAGSKAGTVQLTRHDRKSPTLGAAPPAGAVVLLDYTPPKAPSLAEWTNDKWRVFHDGSMMVCEGNNYTKRKFKNFRLHAEFMVVHGKVGGGGNSGFYLLDRYEVQVFDSFGREHGKGGCAAIYQTFAPSANACLPAGRWQTYDITFRAAVMAGKKVVKHPRITVVHNGVKVHDDVEIPHATGVARVKGDVAEGPIMLQDHGSPVRFRNIWLVEIDGQ